ncbi:MAG: hypothetical protein ACJ71K_12105 [Nitrososphaeraceae archaeon]|jgi:hypothetical protein
MIIQGNDKDSHKLFCAAHTTAKKPKSRLSPDAQRLILENATVNRIKGDVDYANAFLLRSLRLRLQMEEY